MFPKKNNIFLYATDTRNSLRNKRITGVNSCIFSWETLVVSMISGRYALSATT